MVNKEAAEQLHDYAEVRGLVAIKKYDEALEALRNGNLEASTKTRLETALESKEDYVIQQTFAEFDARIMQALCRKCWR